LRTKNSRSICRVEIPDQSDAVQEPAGSAEEVIVPELEIDLAQYRNLHAGDLARVDLHVFDLQQAWIKLRPQLHELLQFPDSGADALIEVVRHIAGAFDLQAQGGFLVLERGQGLEPDLELLFQLQLGDLVVLDLWDHAFFQ